jgi:microsomal dipeptidase-like Zn-dependent dipeptidase
MIADLHCHYPMHLIRKKPGPARNWLDWLGDGLEAKVLDLAAAFLNDPSLGQGWRVDLGKLSRGGADIVCSVLYWPAAEFSLGSLVRSPPKPAYWADVEYQLGAVEEDLHQQDEHQEKHVIVRTADQLDIPNKIHFVHCVEGGFHLGPEPNQVDARVKWLADHGVVYITLAHIFYREVATGANSIPFLTDGEYNDIFTQPEQPEPGLTELGRAIIRAAYKHKVLIDLSHMREDAINETFALVESLDREYREQHRTDPPPYPLIATHIGMREVVPGQEYNLTAEMAQRIYQRGGLIGLIMAQHQLGTTNTRQDSEAVLREHLDAIKKACKDHNATAIGTDLDGFIKPSLTGLDTVENFTDLESWIENAARGEAEKIIHENARRVLRQAFQGRPVAPQGPPQSPGSPSNGVRSLLRARLRRWGVRRP